MRRKLSMLLICLICLLGFVPVQQAQAVQTGEHIQQLISYYRYYRQDAAADIRRILGEMEAENPEEAARWTGIMDSWRWINEQMQVHTDVLPDGLAEDDSLCIVVMGFKLESNGTMKPELIRRLQTALSSARKYPNAILICTGGATSQRSDITEAGAMKQWLISAGVEKRRIVTETRAANTPENAVYVYKLLQQSYPQVSQVAIITSDYHIYRSMTLFAAEAMLKDLPYTVCTNAVCTTELAGEKELEKQARNLAELAGISLSDVPKPELQAVETEPPQQTEESREETVPVQTADPTAATVPVQQYVQTEPAAEPEILQGSRIPVFALAGFGGALLLAVILLGVLIRVSRPQR